MKARLNTSNGTALTRIVHHICWDTVLHQFLSTNMKSQEQSRKMACEDAGFIRLPMGRRAVHRPLKLLKHCRCDFAQPCTLGRFDLNCYFLCKCQHLISIILTYFHMGYPLTVTLRTGQSFLPSYLSGSSSGWVFPFSSVARTLTLYLPGC